jgi:predicted nucleic-acid-binding protein
MIAIDTNVLLRHLFKPLAGNNPKWQLDIAEALIGNAEKVFISSIVIAETGWVLESVFGCGCQEIYSVIHVLANNTLFQFEDGAVLNQALLDSVEYNRVELSDYLIARKHTMLGRQLF